MGGRTGGPVGGRVGGGRAGERVGGRTDERASGWRVQAGGSITTELQTVEPAGLLVNGRAKNGGIMSERLCPWDRINDISYVRFPVTII